MSIAITFVTETFPPEVNGVAMTVGRLVGGLRERGHRVNVIRPSQGKHDAGNGEPQKRPAQAFVTRHMAGARGKPDHQAEIDPGADRRRLRDDRGHA